MNETHGYLDFSINSLISGVLNDLIIRRGKKISVIIREFRYLHSFCLKLTKFDFNSNLKIRRLVYSLIS